MSIKYGKNFLFFTLICAFVFLSATHFAEAILPAYSCLGQGTSYGSVTKADPTYYDPPPAPKINQFFCSTIGDTYFGKPGVNYACAEGFDQSAPGNLKCTRCTSSNSSGCTSWNLFDYYTCTYLGKDPYIVSGTQTQYYPGYVYDNCTPSIVPPTVSISASPLSIVASQSSTLTWSSTGNPTSCTASGGWSGAQAASGSQSVSPLNTTTYTITCSNSVGSASQSATVTVLDSTPPSVPTGLAVAAVSSSQINLSWGGSSDAGGSGLAGYRIYHCQGPGCTSFAQIATLGSGAISYSNTGLAPTTSYSYYVTAYDGAGNESPASNIATDMTQSPPDTTPPAAIFNLAASNPTFNSVTLSWRAPGDDGANFGTASVYDVRYSTALITSANWGLATLAIGEPTPLVAGTSQSMVVSGLNPLTMYFFAIKARDEVGNESPLSNVVNIPTTDIPDTTPPMFVFTSPASGLLPIGTTSTVLSGTTNEAATCRYAVLAGQDFDTGMTAFQTTGGTNHSQTIFSLTNGGLYAYYVKCRDAANNTSGDFPISFAVDSPLPDTTPPAISNGAPTGILPYFIGGGGTVTISVRTNEPAYCSYNQNTDAAFSAMVTANGTMQRDAARQYHSVSLSVSNGISYSYYIRCQDDPAGNENISGYPISFSVANPPNVLPAANITVGPLSGLAPLDVTANGAASYDTDGTIAQYIWQWGDGTPDTAGATAFTTSHTYTTVGTYTLTLTVRDNQGGVGTASQTITVSSAVQPPPISTTGICAPMCTEDSPCPDSGDICTPSGICVANGSGVGPGRSQGAFSLDGSAWRPSVVGTDTPPNFPANTTSLMMRIQTDANAECQYSETPDAAYGNTAFMKQFYSNCVAGAPCSTPLAISKKSTVAQGAQTYNYYVRCKDSQTNIVNDIDYHLSFTIGEPTLISGPSSYVCWINQNFIKSGIPYLFDICRPQCSVDADCSAPTPTCDLVKKVCIP